MVDLNKMDLLQTLLLCDEAAGMAETEPGMHRDMMIELGGVPDRRVWMVVNNAIYMREGADRWQVNWKGDDPVCTWKAADGRQWRRFAIPYYFNSFIAIPMLDGVNILICGEIFLRKTLVMDASRSRFPPTETAHADHDRCTLMFNMETRAFTRHLNTPLICLASAGVCLEDGSVFICGGTYRGGYYKPETEALIFKDGKWRRVKNEMIHRRAHHTCTLMQDGRVFIAGGHHMDKMCEIFDPVTETFVEAGRIGMSALRYSSSVALPDGRIFMCGGEHLTKEKWDGRMAGIYDPIKHTWTRAGAINKDGTGQMTVNRTDCHTCVLINGGDEVLVIGDEYDWRHNNHVMKAEIYNIERNEWRLAPEYDINGIYRPLEDQWLGSQLSFRLIMSDQ
jgi:hypothetical protein